MNAKTPKPQALNTMNGFEIPGLYRARSIQAQAAVPGEAPSSSQSDLLPKAGPSGCSRRSSRQFGTGAPTLAGAPMSLQCAADAPDRIAQAAGQDAAVAKCFLAQEASRCEVCFDGAGPDRIANALPRPANLPLVFLYHEAARCAERF